MQNFLDINICNISHIEKQHLPLWVYGTLRTGGRFHFYLVDCSFPVGRYRMRGTLMQTVSGDVFVDPRKMNASTPVSAEVEQFTMGQLYSVSLAGLWRIFHLENQSGSFPKAYDIDVAEVIGEASEENKIALWFRLRMPTPGSGLTFQHSLALKHLTDGQTAET